MMLWAFVTIPPEAGPQQFFFFALFVSKCHMMLWAFFTIPPEASPQQYSFWTS
jgi:hypothetical protein